MQYLKQYLKTISDRGNVKLAESISKTAEDVGNQYIRNFNFSDHEIGLLFGNVQSGKTAHYLGVINKAVDAGYKIIIVLAGIKSPILYSLSN